MSKMIVVLMELKAVNQLTTEKIQKKQMKEHVKEAEDSGMRVMLMPI